MNMFQILHDILNKLQSATNLNEYHVYIKYIHIYPLCMHLYVHKYI